MLFKRLTGACDFAGLLALPLRVGNQGTALLYQGCDDNKREDRPPVLSEGYAKSRFH